MCRTRRACDACRKQKFKCAKLSSNTRCRMCVVYNRECSYNYQRKPRKKRGTSSASGANPKPASANDTDSAVVPADANAGSTPTNSSLFVGAAAAKQNVSQTQLSPPISNSASTTSSSQLPTFNTYSATQPSAYECSNALLLTSSDQQLCSDLCTPFASGPAAAPLPRQEPSFVVVDLPSKEALRSACIKFFISFPPLFTINRTTLLQRVEHGSASPALLFCILAVTVPLMEPFGVDSKFLDHRLYGQQASRMLVQASRNPNLEFLQATLIMCKYEWNIAEYQKAWHRLGLAIDTMYALRLHLEVPANMPVVEQESMRRTVWCCFILDRIFSTGRNRPFRVHLNKIRISLPASVTNLLPPSVVDPLQASLYNSNKTILAATTELLALWSDINAWVYNKYKDSDFKPPWDPTSTYATLLQKLHQWHQALPPLLRYTAGNVRICLSHFSDVAYPFMHILFFACKIYLMREYVPVNAMETPRYVGPPHNLHPFGAAPSGYWYRTTEEMFLSAHAILYLLEQSLHYNKAPPDPFITFCVFMGIAANIHLATFPHLCPSISLSPPERLSLAIAHLRKMSGVWNSVRDFYEMLLLFAELCARYRSELAKRKLALAESYGLKDAEMDPALGMEPSNFHYILLFDSSSSSYVGNELFDNLPSSESILEREEEIINKLFEFGYLHNVTSKSTDLKHEG
ncbi:hypothetical protein SJAG_05337 [Schizosaccharomyces japonicus yFS275]|uniref:Zn(2)-C6 fungal-type domain-containing protein n=1 Tax=Schizosaccharomyces japonicus (strain yFS275 / FY16936) TaxID=402676 RepID=B6K7J4_SCHJY|nr:hypothetical protein SJAG_05337 [Schizosaccharomyces japonicus yFS275]EEB09498.2 hypothetical protein SJAG_05337 [Schizosaccharomyces japonicus yFS275]